MTVLKRIEFILELEKLKAILRRTKPVGLDRYENTAEHSWQATMTALVFLTDAPDTLDQLKILKMLLIHDIVEIDAGDVFVYDSQARADIAEEEDAAAVRIFGLLDDPLKTELLELWREFESKESPEAIFAKAIDRVNPVIQNLAMNGQSWVENGISRDQVIAMNSQMAGASEKLWEELKMQLENAPFFK